MLLESGHRRTWMDRDTRQQALCSARKFNGKATFASLELAYEFIAAWPRCQSRLAYCQLGATRHDRAYALILVLSAPASSSTSRAAKRRPATPSPRSSA